MTERIYVASKAWRPAFQDGRLVLTAGADSVFMLDQVDATVADEIAALWRDALQSSTLSAPALSIVEELVVAGIVNPVPLRTPTIEVRFVGGEIPALIPALCEAGIRVVPHGAALICFVRTAGRLADLLNEDYHAIRTPHLLIDVAYEHTISLGPLVHKDDTACFGCLAGRVSHFWGDAEPPEEPVMSTNIPLVAGLIGEAVRGFARASGELINATVSLDAESFTTSRNTLYKLPMCPGCRDGEPVTSGRIPLPWLDPR